MKTETTGVWVPVAAVVLFTVCGGYRQPAQEGVRQEPSVAPQVMVGTCRTVDSANNRFDLITGVAEALRVEWFRVDQNSEILLGGRRARLVDIPAGTVLRVQYRHTPSGYVAERVESAAGGPGRGDR